MTKMSPKPLPLPVSSLTIPTALKALPQWVVWRYAWVEGKERWTKVPYRADNLAIKASSTNPETWATFEQALATYQAGDVDGLGFVLTEVCGIVGIDLDHCRDPDTGAVDAWAVDIVQAIKSYTEVSPSGTGLRLFAKGTLPGTGRKVGDREIYAFGRYLTLTGCHLQDTPRTIEACQPAIDEVYQRYFPTAKPPIVAPASNGAGPGRTDEEVLALARGSRNGGKFDRLWDGDLRGYPSASEADLALCMILAFWTEKHAEQVDRLFRASALMRSKWDQRHGEQTYGAKTITEALKWQTEYYQPARQRTSSSTSADSTPAQDPPTGDHIHLTDVGNGERLVRQFGEGLRYVTTWKKWLQWQENRWVLDPDGGVEWHVKQVISGLYAWAYAKIAELGATVGGDDAAQKQRAAELEKVQSCLSWALKSESGTHIDLAVRRARSNPQVRISHDALDTDPMLLQVINGTIDLRTGELRASRRSDLITKRAPVVYDPDAICPLWQASLQRTQGHQQNIDRADRLITYLKRLVGWSLTADVTEQILLFLYGKGQNGKSVFLNTIRAMLGDYAMQAPPSFLLSKDREQHPTELSDLFGKRFVCTIEVEKGKQFALALVKMLTGGEQVRARRMREDFWEFSPTWKIWLAANDKPRVTSQDKATWRRIKMIPFEVTIPDADVDPDLAQKLLGELPGILNWALEGCLEWQEQGLQEPQEVTDATEAYRVESNTLQQFTDECCLPHRDVKTQSSVLLNAYEIYTGESVSPFEFSGMMQASGYKKKTVEGRVYWLGLGLKLPEDQKRQKD